MSNFRCAILLCGLCTFPSNSLTAADGGTELEDRTVLRVCADPSNLPYTNRAKTGFENKIAEMLAADLGIPLAYYWFPQSTGFVRTTLQARKCDLITGISAGNEALLNTNPYYSSIFTLVYRADAGYDLTSLSDERLQDKRIGVVAGTPPVGLLLEKGLLEQVAPYHLVVDTRVDSPAQQIVKDILSGKLDVAVLWGPLAGYLSKRYSGKLKVTPLTADHSERHRMIYSTTMGVRFGEIKWKRQLNRFLRRNQEKIRALLTAYNVPVVEE